MIVEVLTEGASDVPVIRELLSRHFGMLEHEDFRIHAHRGKGKLPRDISQAADPRKRGLLDQLPAKLRRWGRYMDDDFLVIVLVDADEEDPNEICARLEDMRAALTQCPPRVIFCVAVEETESWFIADLHALKTAFPAKPISNLQWIEPDQIVGAWERLAECFGRKLSDVSGSDKTYWAEKIAPHLDFENPRSPSLNLMVQAIQSEIVSG